MAEYDIEYSTIEIPVDENFQAELTRLQGEGWVLQDGTKPIATYRLQRVRESMLQMGLDETKITIIRGNGSAA